MGGIPNPPKKKPSSPTNIIRASPTPSSKDGMYKYIWWMKHIPVRQCETHTVPSTIATKRKLIATKRKFLFLIGQQGTSDDIERVSHLTQYTLSCLLRYETSPTVC